MHRTLSFLILTALASAGCVSTDAPVTAAHADDTAIVEALAFSWSGTDCMEGGGHSVHPQFLNPLPEPWMPADIIDDVGPQFTYSEVPDPMNPLPQKGNTMGNYHATMWCEGWTVNGEARADVFFGFVGMKVERPEWSDDAPTHHYLVTVVATNDQEIHAALVAGGIHAMLSTAERETLAGDVLRIQMHTDHNGDYDSVFKPKAFGKMNAEYVRLWFQHENADGTYAPVSLNLVASGGTHAVAEGQGYFSHSGTHHHDPLPGAYGHTAAILYESFDRTFAWGPRGNVTLDAAYDH